MTIDPYSHPSIEPTHREAKARRRAAAAAAPPATDVRPGAGEVARYLGWCVLDTVLDAGSWVLATVKVLAPWVPIVAGGLLLLTEAVAFALLATALLIPAVAAYIVVRSGPHF